jgi:hypothetical protein
MPAFLAQCRLAVLAAGQMSLEFRLPESAAARAGIPAVAPDALELFLCQC